MAASASQLNIICEPARELCFSGDFREATVHTLFVKNPGNEDIAFKMKTTSPHRYIVKPHKGKIPPKGQLRIAITLLPFHYKKEFVYRDKFLIMACLDTEMNVEKLKKDFFTMVEPSERFQRKLACMFRYEGNLEQLKQDFQAQPLVDQGLVRRIVLGHDDQLIANEKMVSAKKEISALRLQEKELKLLNARLKQDVAQRAQFSAKSTEEVVEKASIPILYLVFICCLTLAVGIVTGKML